METDNGTMSTAVTVRPASLPSVQEMRNKLEQRREVRALLLTYLREEMVEGQHFGTIPGTNAPMLYQDGARLVQTIFDVTSGKPGLDEEYGDDGHYRCTATVPLVSLATGDILYYGVGTCSTQETKYAHRWVFDNEVPTDVDLSSLKSVTKNYRPPKKGTFTRYLLPNPDLGDLHHTILTMAVKRADTRATMKLPSVGDIFMEPDAKDPEAEDEERTAVLDKLRAWFRGCVFTQRDVVASLVFRVRSQKALSGLATDLLAEGVAILETAEIDWESSTLTDDYKAWQKAKGAQSRADLFGDDPPAPEHVVLPSTPHGQALGQTSEKLSEGRDQGPAIPRASERLDALKAKAEQEVAKRAQTLQCSEDRIWEYMGERGFDIDDLSPAILSEFREHLLVFKVGSEARHSPAEQPLEVETSAGAAEEPPAPILTLGAWLKERARDKGVTQGDVVRWLKDFDKKDLFGQAAFLDPFAELPECLDQLDALLQGMPGTEAAEAWRESSYT